MILHQTGENHLPLKKDIVHTTSLVIIINGKTSPKAVPDRINITWKPVFVRRCITVDNYRLL